MPRGGIHVAGGGALYASGLTVTTNGGSSAAIRSDRGSGTMVVDGGSYTSNGSGSPAVYVTADITIHGDVIWDSVSSLRMYLTAPKAQTVRNLKPDAPCVMLCAG